VRQSRRFFSGCETQAEVAKLLGMSKSEVNRRLNRVLALLKKSMGVGAVELLE
jgi:DNA-directed RNA polymerase specialized sigma24 family protein